MVIFYSYVSLPEGTYVYLPPHMFHWNVGHGGMVTGLGWEDLFTPARSAGEGWEGGHLKISPRHGVLKHGKLGNPGGLNAGFNGENDRTNMTNWGIFRLAMCDETRGYIYSVSHHVAFHLPDSLFLHTHTFFFERPLDLPSGNLT